MLSINNLSLRYGEKILFKDLSFKVSGKERLSIVGSNGTGKSSLLKVITGIQKPDSGEVMLSKHSTIGYLPQEEIVFKGRTIFDEVHSAAEDINRIKSEIDEINVELSQNHDHDSEEYIELLNRLGELTEKFGLIDGYRIEAKIERILKGLGFKEEDFGRLTDEFSGGWQMRIAIAKLLLKNPSVLMLDEPTNHLDINSLIWFENYVKDYEGSVIVISHDRNFIDNIATRTLELSMGKAVGYSGNFSFYINEKRKRMELAINQHRNQQKYLKQQNRFIERFRYKSSKAKAVQSRIKLLERLELVQLEDEEAGINFSFPPATHSGKVTFEMSGMSKSYDGINYVLEDINININRGEKIAFVGDNGAGKSTLARIIAGIEPFNTGELRAGHLVVTKYYSQNQADELDQSKSVLEIMDEASTGEVRRNLRSILGGFLFSGDDVFKPVRVLSGGEKSRLALAKMLIEPSNFLILDEPTNHLDMKSKDVLMRALQDYEGTIIIVSHDREFLDGIVDKVIEVKNKNIRVFIGNCSDYIESVSISAIRQEQSQTVKLKKNVTYGYNEKRETKRKILPVKKEIGELEKKLEAFEHRKNELEMLLSEPDIYKEPELMKQYSIELDSVANEIDLLLVKWEQASIRLTELEEILNIN
ncbi:MAG: ABC-F family ATP-binding cassette domain-containing protein [Ignavibacteriaceae bacterium]|nr:MAG: ABC transporter ATP-binding protein [Chlorobiota bacterium]MBV6398516.1 putative ABC transporter ATP-binding protein YheS [Ignavibacteria bacterium]MCC6885751.1 ABC-F family ATP-binding cassette domain-containing protein [Ignavibacteriales bacterium]MCE7953054.1 ABC transporter ATP-binding protein [Chlorobi bacterium CHB7]MDL1887108.1 ABC-F family ATP-binding cassette domain-containing protein [Ignavibacteria bacterium CHB1]MEB2329163.1 ABC-F family ATP-binding cassette domain-containi